MDAKTILTELVAAGMKQMDIADAIGMNQSGVSRLMSGEQTHIRYSVGEKLMALHRKRMRRARNGAERQTA